MAKHNLFLGTGKGSVGDVTVYRRSGSQVTRVRVRDVANPRTTSQSTQRNFLAPVAKFYAPLAVVLEKSYEGLSKSASYSAFLKKNIEKARQEGYYLDKGTPFFPLPYQVSRGTIAPIKYELNSDGGVTLMTSVADEGNDVGTLSKHLMSLGYQAGDQVTFIIIADDQNGNYFPQYGRFIIEPESTAIISSVFPDLRINVSNSEITIESRGFHEVGGCVIISRFENGIWRRSTQSLIVKDEILLNITSEAARKAAIASYGDNVASGDGNVYLDGAGTAFNIAAQDGTALLFYGGQMAATYTTSGETAFVQLTPANKSVPFFIKIGAAGTAYLSGAANSAPSAWTKSAAAPEDANAANTIVVESADSDMAKYLMSIGVPVAQLS